MNDKNSMDELLASVNTMIDQVDKESDAVLRVLNHDPMAQKAAHSELIRETLSTLATVQLPEDLKARILWQVMFRVENNLIRLEIARVKQEQEELSHAFPHIH